MAELRFEEALDKLEGIVNDLERGSLSLDDAIKKYEEGMRLSQFCYKKLNEIQKKVEVLVKDSVGNLTAKDFSTAAADKETSAGDDEVKHKDPSRRKRPKAEELLF